MLNYDHYTATAVIWNHIIYQEYLQLLLKADNIKAL